MSRKNSHTGMRNGDLFCFNCGTSQKLPLPMPVDLAGEWMIGFAKVHSKCPKTWVEPVADPALDYSNVAISRNANWWLVNGERGMSSETMYYYFTGVRIGKRETHPCDPDDFRRCYLLLKAVPQWKTQLHKLKVGGKIWSNLVDNWGKLTEMLEEQMKTRKANGMFEFMQSLGC
jgi:hypothetical protein